VTTRRRTTRTGLVATFDDPRGLGTVDDDDGRRYDFHCTAVADGSRTIAVGIPVTFLLAPAHRGRFEARDIQPRPGGGHPELGEPELRDEVDSPSR
jgi:cold shock CspA family protein